MNLKKFIKAHWGFQGWSLTLFVIAAFLLAQDLVSQNYGVSLRQRRMGDKIGVEVWVKKLNSAAPKIGSMSVAVTYNTTFLTPTDPSTYSLSTTDSVDYDAQQAATLPYRSITSGFHSANGYSALTAQAHNAGGLYVYQLDVSSSSIPNLTGVTADTTNRGSFVGMLKFNIGNHSSLTNSTLTGIALNSSTVAGDFVIYDVNGNNIESTTTLNTAETMTIRGITILNPNGPSEAVNRNKTYTSLSVAGYPIYFERSGLITPAVGTEYGSNKVAYGLQYSTDDGTTWSADVARIAEHRDVRQDLINANTEANHINGEVSTTTGTAAGYYMTQGDGTQMPALSATNGYGGIVRIIWSKNEYFAPRSEKGRIKLYQLDQTGTTSAISARAAATTNPYDISDAGFVLSRVFFLQLNGTTSYLKSRDKFTNAAQLTVEAWVNLNSYNTATGANPGIVATGPGTQSTEEGAWTLYLHEGKYPAFRVRERVGGAGRGENGGSYIATLISPDSLTTVSDATPIQNVTGHPENWTHIAATVDGNIVKLYVNGELVAKTINNNATNITMPAFKHPVWIGVDPKNVNDAGSYLHAGIKEVKVWTKALTQTSLRHYISGVNNPTSVTTPADDRRALIMYYGLTGTAEDLASDATYQDGTNPIYYYTDPSVNSSPTSTSTERFPYRPDRAHIKLTAPATGAGVQNLSGKTFPVRWAGFGIGDYTSNTSNDLVIEYSRDGGTTWATAIDDQGFGQLLDTVEVEGHTVNWEPYKSASTVGAYNDLQAVTPVATQYSKSVIMRVRGTADHIQNDISSTSGAFTVAPHFAVKQTGNTVVAVKPGTSMNLTGGIALLESWIRPYRLPSTSEGYFPIINKKDSATGNTHYALRLLSTGQLQFVMQNAAGTTYSTTSDSTHLIHAPNAIEYDSTWTHVAVWMNLANGTGESRLVFYIDGFPVTESVVTGQTITVNKTNTYPTFIGYEPGVTTADGRYFLGEYKGVRYWNGAPGTAAYSATEPSDLTNYIRGLQGVRATELNTASRENLVASFDLDGGSWVANDYPYNSLFSVFSSTDSVQAQVLRSNSLKFTAAVPFLKVVEPMDGQEVANTTTNLRVRWVGFDYDRDAFKTGDGITVSPADLEWSIYGGGGTENANWNYAASDYDNASFTDAFTLPLTSTYRFQGITTPPHVQFAGLLNVSKAKNNSGTQDKITATNQKARLQLKGRTTVNYPATQDYTYFEYLRTQSPFFTITPASNFTVRVLLEGYQLGAATAFTGSLGTTFASNGMRISLYKDQNGLPGDLVATSLTASDYASKDPLASAGNRGQNGSEFANVPFIFTNVLDNNNYFVLVEHQNHFPVMSKYAAPFRFTGDNAATWEIESGWDFQGWTGTAYDTIISSNAAAYPPTITTKYTAYGSSATNPALSAYGVTGLHYNDGRDAATSTTTSANSLAAMVAGDVMRDGYINVADRVKVRVDAGGTSQASDVTGDGSVNATDRNIVDRNSGLKYSLYDVFPTLYASSSVINNNRPFGDMQADADAIEAKLKNAENMAIKAKLSPATQVATEEKKAPKNNMVMANTISYRMTADPVMSEDGKRISLNVYIQNLGKEWAPGNCTFAFNYNPSKLAYVELANANTKWSSNDEKGYIGEMYSAPKPNSPFPNADLRTIEIDYDFFAKHDGVLVPTDRTLVGTLVFDITEKSDEYKFDWNKTTAIYDNNGNNLSGNAKLDDIATVSSIRFAKVTYPNGGEELKSGKIYNITWSKPTAETTVFVELSADNGATWSRVSPNYVNVMDATYEWSAPQVNSTECLVRLVDANSLVELDRTDNVFTVSPAKNLISRPSTADPVYFANAKDAIKWQVEIPATVEFFFSENGVSNWVKIAADVNSQSNQMNWTIPSNVNSKSARVQMIDASTKELIAISEPFKVLAGNLNFTTPTAGKIAKGGSKEQVRWNSTNVNTFDAQLSLDGGITWTTIEKNLVGLTKSYVWSVKDGISTDKAVVRAIWNGDEEMEYTRTGLFKISPSTTDVENGNNLTFTLGEAYPNPFTTEATFNYTLPTDENVTIEVFNTTGAKVATVVNNVKMIAGDHNFNLKSEGLNSGSYFVKLTAGSQTASQQVVIVK